jgi:uncharacterized protein YecE (DUF72 family)
MVDDFYGIIGEGLKEKLGCVLFQMPPNVAYKPEKLEQIIENLEPSFKNVLEFRHESWWNPEVYDKLSKQNITFCSMRHPQLPDDVIQNTKVLYFRFHGVPNLYSSPYDMATLQRISNEIIENLTIKEVFIYFNNDIGGSAIKNATEMEDYVSR